MIYEITAIVKTELVEEYEKYMRERHIPDLLATGYFRAASLMRSAPGRFRIIYEAFDRAALDDYLNNDAARLRADFQEHFPEGVDVSREVWEILKSWRAA